MRGSNIGRSPSFLAVTIPACAAACIQAMALWFLGYPESALSAVAQVWRWRGSSRTLGLIVNELPSGHHKSVVRRCGGRP